MKNKDIKNYGITDINGYIHNQQIKDAEFLIRLEQSQIQLSNLRMKIICLRLLAG
jgi:hypothetical protein